MPDIVLATLNAKYIHAAFGLRCLMANLGELQERAALLEFEIHQRALDVAEALLATNPKLIGLGVYIWNAAPTLETVAAIKQIRPEVTVVLGGPEISHETNAQPIAALADYVITGEADFAFANLCRDVLQGHPPAAKVVTAELPDLARLASPYRFYTDRDVAHRMVYVEASRGCPFTCEFCLSSLDVPVRQFPLEPFLAELDLLLRRGVRQFKFVDRTFNLNLQTSKAILQFFLDRYQPDLFFHFEMIPDRLPDALREVIARFPPGALQFEVGIQSFNEDVCALIRRRQDARKVEDHLQFLRRATGVHIHADLIAGLPGESMDSFGRGFDRLAALDPQEIQVGILKRLRGTPIVRHDAEWGMRYHPHPPYEVLQTKLLSFDDLQRLRRFSRYWDLVANSGNFNRVKSMLWQLPAQSISPFHGFLRWSDWLFTQIGRTDSIALPRLAAWLFQYLTDILGHDPVATASVLWRDYRANGRRDKPAFLRTYIPDSAADRDAPRHGRRTSDAALPKRQSRHLAASENVAGD